MAFGAHRVSRVDTRLVWRDFPSHDIEIVADPLNAARGILVALPIAALIWAAAAIAASQSFPHL